MYLIAALVFGIIYFVEAAGFCKTTATIASVDGDYILVEYYVGSQKYESLIASYSNNLRPNQEISIYYSLNDNSYAKSLLAIEILLTFSCIFIIFLIIRIVLQSILDKSISRDRG